MKNIKTYETFSDFRHIVSGTASRYKYKIGDYIKSKNYGFLVTVDFGKIIDRKRRPITHLGDTIYTNDYEVKNVKGEIEITNEAEIQRKATPKEIEQFELEYTANKYNL